MKLEMSILAGAESKAFLVELTKQIDRLEKLQKLEAKDGDAEPDQTETESETAEETEATEATEATEVETDEEETDDFAPASKKKPAKKTKGFDEDEEEEAEETEELEEEETAPVQKSKPKKITLDDVNDACKAKAKSFGGKEGIAKVKAILKKKFGTESVSKLSPEQYAECVKAMKV